MKLLLISCLIIHSTYNASGMPKLKNKLNLDQKQAGDYNIRLNLKDFQIIALLGEDSIGDVGSLDYNYDYSELTIKPSGGTTTTTTTTAKPENVTELHLTNSNGTSTTTKAITIEEKPLTETTKKPLNEASDKIPVFVQIPKKIANRQNIQSQTGSMVPQISEEHNHSSVPSNNVDSVRVRRCPAGLTRDKRGRCRKLRRPQFPFELARIASSLAARLSPITRDETDIIEK